MNNNVNDLLKLKFTLEKLVKQSKGLIKQNNDLLLKLKNRKTNDTLFK